MINDDNETKTRFKLGFYAKNCIHENHTDLCFASQ